MKYQQMVFRIEEISALVSMYEQTLQGVAKVGALLATVQDSENEDQEAVEEARDKHAQLQTRLEKVTEMLLRETKTSDIEKAIEVVESNVARIQQFQQIRADQLGLKTKFELETALVHLPAETRQEVEAKLTEYQTRLDTLVQQCERDLGMKNLIALA